MKKLAKEEFIDKAKKIHSNFYDYSLVNYINNKIKVKIICPVHGIFEQSPHNHLNGRGCPKCAVLSKIKKQKKTTEQFINEAKEIHSNFYDYSLTNYTNARNKIKIICPVHGIFEQIAGDHLNGCGCSKCSGTKIKTKEEFIKRVNKIHGNKYDYSLVDYINNKTKIKLICPVHGIFEQRPNDHLNGCGCPICGKKNSIKKQTTTKDRFIGKANKLHNNFYDYSLVNYINNKTKVKIICPKHGIFEQKPNNHLNGQGCPKCKSSKGENAIRKYLKENNILFEEQKKFKETKNLRYDFYLPKENLLIEYNGIQHYELVEIFGGEKKLKYQQYNDKIKKEFAEKNNIKLLTISYKENPLDKLNSILTERSKNVKINV